MKKVLFTLCYILLLSASAAGQSASDEYGVKGRVIDYETGEPLISCNVMLMTTDTARMMSGASTNKAGSFHIKDISGL